MHVDEGGGGGSDGAAEADGGDTTHDNDEDKSSLQRLQQQLDCRCDWIAYERVCQVGNMQLLGRCTLVSSLCVALFAGPIKMADSLASSVASSNAQTNNSAQKFKIDNWIAFDVDIKVCIY